MVHIRANGQTLAFRSKRRVTLPELPAALFFGPGDAGALAPVLARFAGLAWPLVLTAALPLWLPLGAPPLGAPPLAVGAWGVPAVSRKKVRTGKRRPW